MTFDEIMEMMLARVPDDIDKREDKSLIWHTLSPVAAMVAELLSYGDNIHNSSIPDNDMCSGSVLTRKCAEHGVNRYLASKAIRLGEFEDFDGNPATVNLGEQFAAEGVEYTAIEQIAAGQYKLECTQSGIIGNSYFGPILPLDSGHQLGTATLTSVLEPGEDDESDLALQARFYLEVNAQPFGGNLDQYTKWVSDIPGVSSAKIFPTPNNQGGRVHCVIVGPGNQPVSPEFLATLQDLIDPEPHSESLGIAPIGHRVTFSTVATAAVNVAATVQLKDGFALISVLSDAKDAVAAYLEQLSFVDDTVRQSHVEATILSVNGVKDIDSVSLNGYKGNISLEQRFDSYQIPVLGELTLTEE